MNDITGRNKVPRISTPEPEIRKSQIVCFCGIKCFWQETKSQFL